MQSSRAGSWSDELVCKSIPDQDYCKWILLSNVAQSPLPSRISNIISGRYKFIQTSQQLMVHNLPNHPSSEVGHVFLWIKEKRFLGHYFNYQMTLLCDALCDYLCECDWLVFGNVICIFACEHSTVATIHLLWDFLKIKRGGIKMLLDITQCKMTNNQYRTDTIFAWNISKMSIMRHFALDIAIALSRDFAEYYSLSAWATSQLMIVQFLSCWSLETRCVSLKGCVSETNTCSAGGGFP